MVSKNLVNTVLVAEADLADKYRFARKFAPGGHLPWEKTKEEENKNE